MVFVETISTDFITLNNGLTKLRKKHNKTINLRFTALIYVKFRTINMRTRWRQKRQSLIQKAPLPLCAIVTKKLFQRTTDTLDREFGTISSKRISAAVASFLILCYSELLRQRFQFKNIKKNCRI